MGVEQLVEHQCEVVHCAANLLQTLVQGATEADLEVNVALKVRLILHVPFRTKR